MKKNTISDFRIIDDYQTMNRSQSDNNIESFYFMQNINNTNLIILNIYFCGTGATIDDTSLLVGLMHKYTIEDNNQLKIGFDGCAFNKHGNISISGALFGVGINRQCYDVVMKVNALIKEQKQIKLNILGHDRGAIAAAKLAKLLANFDKDILEINMILLDPVPGNSTFAYKIDLFGATLATQAQDLSNCRNLSHVLSLYSNISAPLFAPLIFKYPKNCQVIEDVTPGDHHGIQEISCASSSEIIFRPRSYICFFRIKTFFEGCGTNFKFDKKLIVDTFPKNELEIVEENSNINRPSSSSQEYDLVEKHEALLICYKMELQEIKEKIVKKCHTNENVYIKTCPKDVSYVNHHHRQLYESNPSVSNLNFNNKIYALCLNHPLKMPEETLTFDIEIDPQQVCLLFKKLIQTVKAALSYSSQHSPKYQIINSMQNYLESSLKLNNFDNFDDIQKTKNALRNLIAVVIQENEGSPLFNMTQSGRKLLRVLNSIEYKSFADLIMNSCLRPVTYNDLRKFVTGSKDKSLFNSTNKQFMYDLFQTKNNANVDVLTENRFNTPEVEIDPHQVCLLFKKLIQAVKDVLSYNSQHSPKCQIINSMLINLELNSFDNFGSIQKIKNALRNFIAIVLQENDSTLFSSMTQSGRKLLGVLNSIVFKSFADLILGSCSGPVTYNDLRKFVTGNNDKSLFNSSNKQFMYNLFQAKSNDNVDVLTENRFTTYFTFKK